MSENMILKTDADEHESPHWGDFPRSSSDDSETSRYITVGDPFQTDSRKVYFGKHDRFVFRFDKEAADFVPVAESIEVVDIGIEISPDELTDWCGSDAGRAVLHPFFHDLPAPTSEGDDGLIDR